MLLKGKEIFSSEPTDFFPKEGDKGSELVRGKTLLSFLTSLWSSWFLNIIGKVEEKSVKHRRHSSQGFHILTIFWVTFHLFIFVINIFLCCFVFFIIFFLVRVFEYWQYLGWLFSVPALSSSSSSPCAASAIVDAAKEVALSMAVKNMGTIKIKNMEMIKKSWWGK